MENIIAKVQSNQLYSVTLSILLVTFTLYILNNSLKDSSNLSRQKFYEKSEYEANCKFEMTQNELLRRTKILNRLREWENICYDLEIFTNIKERRITFGKISAENKITINDSEQEEEQESYRTHQSSRSTNKKENEFVNPAATTSSIKRDQNLNKKNTSTEPIIYLFALIFIYLLLKAASDISQHYKMQSKGDKRLRRCSLQSYAQMHKPDRRRSSKVSSVKCNVLGTRTRSVDCPMETEMESKRRKNHLLSKLRKYTSIDSSSVIPSSKICGTSIDNNQVNNHRRCSTPMTSNIIVANSLARRTSMGGFASGTLIMKEDRTSPEARRRVRMLNRH